MDRWFQSLATPALAVALLYFGRPLFVPLAVAILLAIVLTPTVKRLERLAIGRIGLGRIPAVLIVSAGVAAFFLGVGWLLATQGREIVEDLPEYRRIVEIKLHDLRKPIDSLQRVAREMQAAAGVADQPAPAPVKLVEGSSGLLGRITGWAGSLVALLGTAGLVVVLLVFLLIEREDLRNRVIRVAGHANMRVAITAFGDATRRVTRYVRALALINFGQGVVVGTGLWLMGLPGAPLFGLLSALFRFVPYVGPWVAAALPIALSIAVFDTWTRPLMITGMFAAIELVGANFIEPMVYGASLGLSPFGVILSAIFWAWLWGPIGLVVATPLTVCLVVLGRHVPRLEGLSILLGDAEPLQPSARLYQRLLARDIGEAIDLVEVHSQEHGLLSAWDAIVLPALCLIDRDQQNQMLEEDELECAREILDVLVSELPEAPPLDPALKSRAIPCLPVRAWGDRFACQAFARLLEGAGVPALPGERMPTAQLVDSICRSEARAVCLWSLDLLGAGAVRHLVARIRRRAPEIDVVLGVCGAEAWRSELAENLRGDERLHVVDTFSEAHERLIELARPDAALSTSSVDAPGVPGRSHA